MSRLAGDKSEGIELTVVSPSSEPLTEARGKPLARTRIEPSHAPLPRKRHGWLWTVLLVACAAGAYFGISRDRWQKLLGAGAAENAPRLASRAVPVVVAQAHQGDMDLYLNGLGSVTPMYSVVLRSRVDGELVKVAFTEGQYVKQGDLLAEIDPRPYEAQLKQAEGQLLKDEAALKLAQLDLERYTILSNTKSVTKQQLDTQTALEQQQEGAIAIDKAQIDNVKLQLTYCRITAPISGRIGLRLVDPGNMVHASDPNGLAVINQVQPITVVFTIPQDEISRVQKQWNSGRKLAVDAFDREIKNRLATGMLLAIDNQVDVATGTVRLKAIFENQDNLLFPNQFVNARLLVETRHGAIVVPTAAVQRGPESTFVYVVKPDETVDLRNVLLGPTEGEQTCIESGLSAGETVVIDGVDKLQPGAKVVTRETRGAPPGESSRRPAA